MRKYSCCFLLLVLVLIDCTAKNDGNSSMDDDEDDDDSTTPLDPPGPEYCPERTPECCLTHAAYYPDAQGHDRADEFVWVSNFEFSNNTEEEWNRRLWSWFPESIKDECPYETCVYSYTVYFVLRPPDSPWPGTSDTFGMEYVVSCYDAVTLDRHDIALGPHKDEPRISERLDFDIKGSYSFTPLGGYDFRLQGLDLFPFVDNESYLVEIPFEDYIVNGVAYESGCTKHGGDALIIRMEGVDGIVFNAYASGAAAPSTPLADSRCGIVEKKD